MFSPFFLPFKILANSGIGAREGTQHTLEVIKNNPTRYAPNKIEGIDLRFEDLPSNMEVCTNCRYDIKFLPGNGVRFAEFKSYALSTWGSISDSKFVNQFKTYLADISSIDELVYVINTQKASIADVKTAFKNMMFNSSANQLTDKGQEIFDNIWSNVDLRNSLFDLSNYPTNLSQSQLKQLIQSDFESLISNTQSNIYSFIKAE